MIDDRILAALIANEKSGTLYYGSLQVTHRLLRALDTHLLTVRHKERPPTEQEIDIFVHALARLNWPAPGISYVSGNDVQLTWPNAAQTRMEF